MPDRLDKALAEIDRIKGEMDAMSGQLAADRVQRDATHADRLERSLGPMDLTVGMRRGDGGVPQQADALRQRLLADSMSPAAEGQSGALYSANALNDPAFESILRDGQTVIGTGWTPVGTAWLARIVPISGTDPDVLARRTYSRRFMEGHIYRSDIIVFDCSWASATGEALVEFRPLKPVKASPHIDWPWAVVACRVYVDNVVRAWSNLDSDDADDEDDPPTFIRMAMHTGAYAGDVEEEGDETDLEELSDDRMESQIYAATEAVDRDHWWVVQIGLRKSSGGAGGVAVAIAEPQFNYSYQEAPMPWEENHWDTGGGTVPPGGGDGADECLFDDFDRDSDREDQGWWSGVAPVWEGRHSARFSGGGPDSGWTNTSIVATQVKRTQEFSGERRVEWTSPENEASCSFGGTWLGWAHQEIMFEAVYGSIPLGALALAVELSLGAEIGMAGQAFDVRVLTALPATEFEGTVVGTMVAGEEKRFDIDISLVPPSGPLYVAVSAQWRATARTDSGWFFCGGTPPVLVDGSGLSGEVDTVMGGGSLNRFQWVTGSAGLGNLPTPCPRGWWPGGNLYQIDDGDVDLDGAGNMRVISGGANDAYAVRLPATNLLFLPFQSRNFRIQARYRVSPRLDDTLTGLRYLGWGWESDQWVIWLGDTVVPEGVSANSGSGTPRGVPQDLWGYILMEMYDGQVRAKVWEEGGFAGGPWDSTGATLAPLVPGDGEYLTFRMFGSLGTGQTLLVDSLIISPRPMPGDDFLRLTIGIADGISSTFLGFGTSPATALFYIDDHLTEPLSHDETTGAVTFDRNPSFGAVIKQSGQAL